MVMNFTTQDKFWFGFGSFFFLSRAQTQSQPLNEKYSSCMCSHSILWARTHAPKQSLSFFRLYDRPQETHTHTQQYTWYAPHVSLSLAVQSNGVLFAYGGCKHVFRYSFYVLAESPTLLCSKGLHEITENQTFFFSIFVQNVTVKKHGHQSN